MATPESEGNERTRRQYEGKEECQRRCTENTSISERMKAQAALRLERATRRRQMIEQLNLAPKDQLKLMKQEWKRQRRAKEAEEKKKKAAESAERQKRRANGERARRKEEREAEKARKRMERNEKNRLRAAMDRQKETYEQKLQRRLAEREQYRLLKMMRSQAAEMSSQGRELTEEEIREKERRRYNRMRVNKSRQKETPEQSERRKAANRARMKVWRETKTEEERQRRNAERRLKREMETREEREERLLRDVLRKRVIRANETETQKDIRRMQDMWRLKIKRTFGSMKSFNEAQGQRLDADKDFLADSVVADLVVGKRTPVLQEVDDESSFPEEPLLIEPEINLSEMDDCSSTSQNIDTPSTSSSSLEYCRDLCIASSLMATAPIDEDQLKCENPS